MKSPDVVHTPYPINDSRFRSRVLYPPPDLYAMVAEVAEAVVLGSCCIGTSIDKSRLDLLAQLGDSSNSTALPTPPKAKKGRGKEKGKDKPSGRGGKAKGVNKVKF